MGYSLYIGELQTELDANPGEHVYTHYTVISIEDKENAPLNSTELYSNGCQPSYTGWTNFTKRSNLYNLFFDEWDGILIQHPGAYVLTQKELEIFEHARKIYKKCGNNEIDIWDLRRLDWLCYWTKWALKNCKTPVFVNS